MRQALGIRYLAMVMLVLFLAGCTDTYAYLPSVGSKGAPGAEAQPAATQPGAAAEAPAPAPSRICRSRSRPWRPGCNSWRAG